MAYANNKDADQPAQSLISIFVVGSIDSTIPVDYIPNFQGSVFS